MINKIVVLCSYNFYNITLSHFIESEINLSCELIPIKNISTCESCFEQNNCLTLCDYYSNNEDSLLDILAKNTIGNMEKGIITALYNVQNKVEVLKKFIEMGVRGVFYEDCSLDHFKKGIHALINGELWFSRKILNMYILENFNHGYQRATSNSINTSLTPREKEILMLIASGKTNQEISEECFISPSTVKTHIYNIFQKIHVTNRIQAALWTVNYLVAQNNMSGQ